MGFLKDKKALVLGIASKLSIANGIAKVLSREGCDLALTYQNDRLKERVIKIGSDLNVPKDNCFPCDVSDDHSIDRLVESIKNLWGEFDILIHAIAFAPSDQLSGDFLNATTRSGFITAHEISSYSLIALCKAFDPLMENRNGSVITLSYLGSSKTVPNYNVMGLAKASLEASVRYLAIDLGRKGNRINAISAGPIRTLAASGIKDFRSMLAYNSNRSPLKKNTSIEEVGNTAAFLGSDLASGITGQVIFVDNGFSTTAMGYSKDS